MRASRPFRPAHTQLHGFAGRRLIRRVGRALVEYHHDVGIEYALNPHRLLRREETRIAVHRRLELDPLLRDLSQHTQAEYLETTGICQDRPLPAHKAVQTSMRLDYLQAGAQPKVKSVAQYDVRVDLTQLRRRHCLYRPVGPDRHESGRLHCAMRQCQGASTGEPVSAMQLKFHIESCAEVKTFLVICLEMSDCVDPVLVWEPSDLPRRDTKQPSRSESCVESRRRAHYDPLAISMASP